jgi:hypothetical protein
MIGPAVVDALGCAAVEAYRLEGQVICGQEVTLYNFFVLLAENDKLWHQIQMNIKPPTVPLNNPTRNAFCIVELSKYLWCRAEVTFVSENGFAVHFIDQGGMKEHLPREALFSMDGQPDIVRNTPKLAILCSHNGIAPRTGKKWSSAVSNAFREIFPTSNRVSVKFLGTYAKNRADTYVVEVVVGASSIFDALMSRDDSKYLIKVRDGSPVLVQ